MPHVVKPRRSGDPTYLVADPAAARNTLKFHPSHSDLATIIRTAWAWHRVAHPLKAIEPCEERVRQRGADAPGLAALEQASNSDHEPVGLHTHTSDVP